MQSHNFKEQIKTFGSPKFHPYLWFHQQALRASPSQAYKKSIFSTPIINYTDFNGALLYWPFNLAIRPMTAMITGPEPLYQLASSIRQCLSKEDPLARRKTLWHMHWLPSSNKQCKGDQLLEGAHKPLCSPKISITKYNRQWCTFCSYLLLALYDYQWISQEISQYLVLKSSKQHPSMSSLPPVHSYLQFAYPWCI
jgi:hypothetical protein